MTTISRNPTLRTVRNVATGWKRYGFLPCEMIIRDCFPLPIPHSEREARWCVFMTNAEMKWHSEGQNGGFMSMDGDFYCGEFETKADAERARRRYERAMNAAYDAA